MRFHYYIVVALIKIWPKLFQRYYSEYEEVLYDYESNYINFEEEN